MKTKRLLKLLLVGGLMITSAAISLNSCKKSDADREPNLLTVETVVYTDDDSGHVSGIECPYCQRVIMPGDTHTHHFSPKMGEKELPIYPPNLKWGVLDSIDDNGNVVYDLDNNGNPMTPIHQRMGNIDKPFPVDYCEIDFPKGVHVCRYCAEKIYHRHTIVYSLERGENDGNFHKSWHIGGGAEP